MARVKKPSARFDKNKTDQFDLHPKDRIRFDNGSASRPPEYAYRLTCFCGDEIKLVPQEGQQELCPRRCGGRALFADGTATLEVVDA